MRATAGAMRARGAVPPGGSVRAGGLTRTRRPPEEVPRGRTRSPRQGISVSSPAPDPGVKARVERALARLKELDARPTAEHAPIYSAVHRELSAVLADADAATTPRDGDAADVVRGRDSGEPDDHSNG